VAPSFVVEDPFVACHEPDDSPDELDPTWVQRVVGFRPDTVRPLVNR
jgi:hypothetical protein